MQSSAFFEAIGNQCSARDSSPGPVPPIPQAECLQSYLRQVASYPLLTGEQERSLARRAGGGDAEARHRLIVSNLRLVVKVASQYLHYGVPLCDLIQEGNLGLITAVDRFDWRRGTRFSTYAAYWIREAVTRALTDGTRPIRLTGYAFKRFRHITHKAEELASSLLRTPTVSEMAAATGTLPVRMAQVLSAAAFSMPLDIPRDNGEVTPMEEIACECGCDPAGSAIDHLTATQIKQALAACLVPRERWVIANYFGLDGRHPTTLTEMAKKLNVTPERVRQIREHALAKLRQHLSHSVVREQG